MSRYQAFRQKYPWTARFFLFLLIMVIILSVIRASLPYAIKYSATSWLESQGVTISINEIDMSLLDASFVVNDIYGKNKVGQGFSVNRFGIVWQWKPLFNRLLVIDQLQMSGFSIDVKTFENGDMNIAGLEIKKEGNASKVESDNIPEPAPWDIIVKNISLSDIGFCLETVTDTHNTVLDYCADMGLFKWVGSIRFTPSGQESDSDVP